MGQRPFPYILVGTGLFVGAAIIALRARASSSSLRVWPVSPNRGILSGFGSGRPAKGPYTRKHAAVDLAARSGDKVLAIDRGVVLGPATGYELHAGLGAIVVRHPDADYIYAEIDPSVSPGQEVEAGEVMGTVRADSDGLAMLHLEAWETGKAPSKFTVWPFNGAPPEGLLNAEEKVRALLAPGAKS
jgi:murein DD-endopeptidase MepM/ murein hydrolase activator NlpD